MSPAPGAVVVIAGAGRGQGEAREIALRAFRGQGHSAEVFADGPLTVAFAPGPNRALHVSDTTVCLLDGTLYELGRLRATVGSSEESPESLLAAAYALHGRSIIERLRGDFWTLLWDRPTGRGIVAADQMGGRTPYWTTSRGDVLCASEVPELLAALPRSPEPDPVAVAHWLLLTGAPDGRTLFAGIRRLEAGHVMGLGDGACQPRRYWLPRYTPPLQVDRAELVERIKASLSVSVDRRLPSSPTAGVLLSGGLDSSVLAALVADHRPHAYSAVFPKHPTVDESRLIDLTVQRLGLPSTRIAVRGGSVIAGALSYMAAWRLPPTSPNLFFWTPLLNRAGANGTTVMLAGEGGDELFGFSPYLMADRLRRGRVRSAVQLARAWPGGPQPPSAARVQWRLRRYGVKGAMPPAANAIMRRLRGPAHYASPWMLPNIGRAWLESDRSPFEWKRLPGPRWWSSLLHGVTRGAGPPAVYEQSRRRAALAGIEARHPLVDVDVIELMLQVPPELAFEGGLTRPLLRESVAGKLPEEVRLRPTKSSFDEVFHSILAGTDLRVVHSILGARDAELRAYVDLAVVRRALLAGDPPPGYRGLQTWALQVWRLLTAECWLRSLGDPAYLDRLREHEGFAELDHDLLVHG